MQSSPEIHLNVEKIKISDVPTDGNQLQTWLDQQFQKKDRYGLSLATQLVIYLFVFQRYELTYQYFNKRLVDFIRLLSHFYSLDKDKAGKFPGERNRLQITLAQTLPAAIFYNGCLCLMLTTPETRSLYWKISLFGTILGCVWMSFRSQA